MKSKLYCKILALSVIFLFIGVSFSSAINIQNVSSKEEYPEEEVREVVFQTIIDIINNPEVKELIDRYNYKISFTNNNYKYIIKKILFRSPRLLSSLIFSEQSISYNLLEKLYKLGKEIENIIEEKDIIELLNSIKISNPNNCCELSKQIINYDELNQRFLELSNGLICYVIGLLLPILVTSSVTIFTIALIFQSIPFIYNSLLTLVGQLAYLFTDVFCPLYQDTYDCGVYYLCNPPRN